MIKLVIVTIPPDVVLTLASSTVFVKASSLVNRDFAGIVDSGAGYDGRVYSVSNRERPMRGLDGSQALWKALYRDRGEVAEKGWLGRRRCIEWNPFRR